MKKTKPTFIERQALMAQGIMKLCSLIDEGNHKGKLDYYITSEGVKYDTNSDNELIATGHVVFTVDGMEANVTQFAPDENPIEGEDITEWLFELYLNLDWGTRCAMLGLDGDDQISEEQLLYLLETKKQIDANRPPTIDRADTDLIQRLDNAAQSVIDDPDGGHYPEYLELLKAVKGITPEPMPEPTKE